VGRTQYYVAATIDGYIAEHDGGLDWLTSIEGGMGGYDEFYAEVGALAMGAGTYEWVLDRVEKWPYQDGPTWVFTHRDLKPYEDGDIRFVEGSPGDHIDEMREAAGGKNIWVIGGGVLASQFADEGLLDELILNVASYVLGDGIPLFAGRIPEHLRLTATQVKGPGMVELRYELPGRSPIQ
jgi:dihydrofolate reductase